MFTSRQGMRMIKHLSYSECKICGNMQNPFHTKKLRKNKFKAVFVETVAYIFIRFITSIFLTYLVYGSSCEQFVARQCKHVFVPPDLKPEIFLIGIALDITTVGALDIFDQHCICVKISTLFSGFVPKVKFLILAFFEKPTLNIIYPRNISDFNCIEKYFSRFFSK